MSRTDPVPTTGPEEALGQHAVELVRAAARFTQTVGRVPGAVYSSVAWRVLADLETDGPARVSELAAEQRVAQPTMTSLIHRLEAEAWVERQPDPSDGRAALVVLTRAGSLALLDYRRAAAERIVPLLAQLGAADQETLARASELMQLLSDLD